MQKAYQKSNIKILLKKCKKKEITCKNKRNMYKVSQNNKKLRISLT